MCSTPEWTPGLAAWSASSASLLPVKSGPDHDRTNVFSLVSRGLDTRINHIFRSLSAWKNLLPDDKRFKRFKTRLFSGSGETTTWAGDKQLWSDTYFLGVSAMCWNDDIEPIPITTTQLAIGTLNIVRHVQARHTEFRFIRSAIDPKYVPSHWFRKSIVRLIFHTSHTQCF